MKFQLPKKVLITGAQGSLGRVVVQKYLKAGCRVTGTIYPDPKAAGVEHEALEWVTVDLCDSRWVRKTFSEAHFDAWVHCAGGFRFSTVEQVTDEDLDFLINLNLRSAFYLAREILPGMKKRNWGRIVLVSSKATLRPTVGMSAYAASKAGLNILTESLAEETKGWNICVNAVLPTVLDTEANRKAMPKEDFSRWVSPEDLAQIIFDLTSPQGQVMHGALIPVSGRL
ncbi:MAG: SDR family oxidoreductase [Bdellovibrionia bacterium]